MFPAPTATVANRGLVNIGGIPFVRTPVDNGVDDTGLLVAETPLTVGQRAKIVDELGPLTHGDVGMHETSGDCDVFSRGPGENPTARRRFPHGLFGQNLKWGETLKRAWSGDLVGGARVLRDPKLVNYPAVDIAWFESASIAAQLTDGQDDFVVRIISNDQYDQAVTCGGELTEAEIINIAHLGADKMAEVVGEAAKGRRDQWGLVDMFGNVWTWTSSVVDPNKLSGNQPVEGIGRLLRGALWRNLPDDARVAARRVYNPDLFLGCFGVRFVAAPRTR